MFRSPLFTMCMAILLLSGCSLFHAPEYERVARLTEEEAANQALMYVHAQERTERSNVPELNNAPLELTTHIDLNSLDTPPAHERDIALTLHFDTGADYPADLDPGQLADIAGMLAKDPLATVVVEGHSDNVGDPDDNLALSRQRAERVCTILSQEYGISLEQLRVNAYGEDRPIADNGTMDGRSLNRRVVLAVFPSCDQPSGGSADDAFREQKLMEAAVLYEEGKFQEAYDILSGLLRSYPDDDTVNFHLGMTAFKLGKYPMALFSFERILMRRPEQDRVRLELAVTHVAMEQYEQARKHFETVLSHNPPEAVRQNIEQYMAALEGTSRVGETAVEGAVEVGWFHDSNVNVGPRDREIDTNIGTVLLTEDASPIDDSGMTAAAQVTVTHNLTDEVSVFASTGHTQKRHFEENGFDLISYSTSPGLRVVIDEHLIQAQGRYQHLDYDSNPLLDIWGPRLTYAYMPRNNIQLITDMFWDLRDNRQDDDRDSNYFSGGEYLRVFWGPGNNEFMTGVRIFGENANEARYSNNGWELTGFVDFKMDYGLTPYITATYRATEWNGAHSALAGDDRFDQLIRMKAGLAVDLFLDGLTLDGSLEVVNNSSSFEASEYNKYVPSVVLKYKF